MDLARKVCKAYPEERVQPEKTDRMAFRLPGRRERSELMVDSDHKDPPEKAECKVSKGQTQ